MTTLQRLARLNEFAYGDAFIRAQRKQGRPDPYIAQDLVRRGHAAATIRSMRKMGFPNALARAGGDNTAKHTLADRLAHLVAKRGDSVYLHPKAVMAIRGLMSRRGTVGAKYGPHQ